MVDQKKVEFSSASEDAKSMKEEMDKINELKKEVKNPQQQPSIGGENPGFQIPRDLIGLPSRGKIYPATSNLHMSNTIEIRHMTASDEDILTSRALLRSGKAIDALLRACIVDKSINPSELLSGDKNAVMIALRVGAYGEDYKIDVTCPNCDHESKDISIDLTKLSMKTLEVDPINPGENKFFFELPSGMKVEFKLLNSDEEREIAEALENQKKVMHSEIDTFITSRHKMQILSINGDANPANINAFVQVMSARDSRSLNNYIQKISPDIDMEVDFSCPSCGYKDKEAVPITAGFFWPD